MKLSIAKGSTSVLVRLFIQDSSSTTGAGLTGLVYNSSGLTAYRMRDDDGNAGATAISLATATKGTWASGGFVEKDATNAPGWYEFGIPDNALATGSRSVSFHFKGVTNMAPLAFEIELTGWNNQDAVHGGMSALPNTACTTNASLLTSGTGTDQMSVSAGKVLLQATQSGVTIPTVTTVTNQLTAAQIATGVWQDTTAGDFTVSASIGKSIMNGVSLGTGLTVARCTLVDTLTTYTGDTPQTGDAYARIGAAGVGLTNLGDTRIAHLDADVSSRLATSGYTAPPSAATIATTVWQDATSGSDFTTVGSIGKLLVTDIDATISSRGTSTLTQAQVTGGAYSVQSASCVLGDARIANLDASVAAVPAALLKLDLSGITGEAQRSLLNCLRKLRNKWNVSGTTLTIYKEDDTTPAYTQTVTPTSGASPITAIS